MAKENNQVVGVVNLLFTVFPAYGARVALLEDISVSSRVRRIGVGFELRTQGEI